MCNIYIYSPVVLAWRPCVKLCPLLPYQQFDGVLKRKILEFFYELVFQCVSTVASFGALYRV